MTQFSRHQNISRTAPPRSAGRRDHGRVRMGVLALGILAGLLAWEALPAVGQSSEAVPVAGEIFAGEELENYLRLLQVSGKAPLYPWSLRSFSVGEIDRLAPTDESHPWARRYDFSLAAGDGPELHLIAPKADILFNSAFPHGENDGPVWSGRGVTTAIRAGLVARYRGLSLTLAPVAFWAQNSSFATVRAEDASNPFEDGLHPTQIDLPQRFGSGGYSRIDPGQSTLRADVGPVAVGISTANQVWGPAAEFPLVLGTNAPGFPHVFAGSSRPWNLWIAKVHGRFVWGKLSQSPYASSPADSSERFTTGLVGVITPRGVPGLEIGAGRFFHLPWRAGGPSLAQILKPIETLTKVNLSTDEVETEESVVANQIASVFFRWVPPGSGFEVYGELASEDHRMNLRDFLLQPDHDTAYTLGLRKLWNLDDERFWVLRGELVDGVPSHLQRTRRQEPFYIHAHMRQGHTNEGQILGSPAAYGGSASLIAADLYEPDGRWTVSWRRTRRQQVVRYLQTGVQQPLDVQQGVGIERLLFVGRWDITAGLDGVYEFNRDFRDNAFNLRAALTVQAHLPSWAE